MNIKNIPFIIGFTFILMFYGIVNVKAVNYDNAVEVDTLPTCESTNVNTIYLLSTDNHYHRCYAIPGEIRNIQIGDVLYGNTLYFDFPDDFYTNWSSFATKNTNYFIVFGSANFTNPNNDNNHYIPQISVRPVVNGNFSIAIGSTKYIAQRIYDYVSGNVTINLTEYTIDGSQSWQSYYTLPIQWIDTTNPAYQYIKIALPGGYEYEDLGEYTSHVYYSHIDKDFYLFFDFNTISQFDIFSDYDFTTFTDFQELVIVIGVNVFYLGFLGLCSYILLKLLYKLLSWVL